MKHIPKHCSDERWKRVPDYPQYWVSTCGRLLSASKGRPMSLHPNRTGYASVTLSTWGERKHLPVHRIVARTFLTPDPENPMVNHKDADRSNAHLSNLEWSNSVHNALHARDSGLLRPVIKPVQQIDPTTGEVIKVWASQAEACRSLRISPGDLSGAIKGRVWRNKEKGLEKRRLTAKGYLWRRVAPDINLKEKH